MRTTRLISLVTMARRGSLRRPRRWRRPVLALALTLGCLAVTACGSDGPSPSDSVHVLPDPTWWVPPSLEQQIFSSTVIVRASLQSATAAAEALSDGEGYRAVQELRFTVHEYLKGSGPTTLLVAVRDDDDVHSSEAAAREAAGVASRVTTWDDREGVLFLRELDGAYAPSGGADRSATGPALGFNQSNPDQSEWAYSVDTLSRTWLPAREAGGAERQASDPADMAFITDGARTPAPVITLAELRAKVAALEAELQAGAGIAGYERCVYGRIRRERVRRAAEALSGEAWTPTLRERSLAPGSAAGAEVYRKQDRDGEPQYIRYWLSGPDAARFQTLLDDDDGQSSTGYEHGLRTVRPLPAGAYSVFYNMQHYTRIPCNHVPLDAYTAVAVTVTVPSGTVHEAFFDPVALGAGVGADEVDGVLQPAAFSVGATGTTIERLVWEANEIRLELSAAIALADHYLDLIALDGSVALRLRLDDATTAPTAAGGQAWRWRACGAPWQTGDQLMLRLHHSATALPDVSTAPGCGPPPTFGEDAYDFTLADDAAVGASVGAVTATAAGDAAVSYAITAGNTGHAFAIDAASGAITVAGALDAATTSRYDLIVAASYDAGGGTATVPVTIAVTDFVIDYDADDDGLIDVASLAQLHAIRWDLDGDGTATEAGYAQAFPHAPPGMGCPATGCTGYELTADLDFDADDAYGNGGLGWEPIGSEASPFAAVFDGNGHTIANLFIDRSGTSEIGLFGRTRWPSTIRRVGLPGVDVTGGYDTGGLVGWNSGRIEASYASGRVASARAEVGGLVGWNERDVAASYAAVDVTGGDYAGGLVGGNHGAVTASYATGAVTGGAKIGGLAGWSDGRITASYATGRVTATSNEVGGLVGSNLQSTVTASYWDSETSGQSASAAGVGQTTGALQEPTGYGGIYAAWNVDINGASGGDDPWHFGTASQYPVLQVDFDGDGTPSWEEFGEQRPVVANRPPVFAEGSTTTRPVAEHTAAGEDIGEPVMATDPDAGDVVTYALGGQDAASFDLVTSTGQLQTKLALDYELQAAYEVVITASDDRGGTTTITVTIQVGDVADTPEFEEPEYRFTVTEDATVDTEVGRVTATAGGAEVTYAIPAGNTGDAFAIEPATGALSVAAPLDYLTTEVYTLTVSATAGTGTADVTVTMTVTGVDCANGTAIDDPRSHAALVGDCRVLLAALEVLEGDDSLQIEGGGTLNWSGLRALAQWEGVTTGGTPNRVTGLELPDKSLGGEIPSGLGSLTALTTLDLSANRLTGAVPAELSGLTELRTLRLSGNRVSGCLPTDLRALVAAIDARGGAQDLAQLALAYCNATAPPAPTGLAAAATSATSITLTWEGATDAGSLTYHVEYRVADSDDAWTAVVRDEPTAATQVVDGLTCGTGYAFRVSAFGDGVGSLAAQGPWSAAHPAATNGCAPVFDAASYEFPISAGAAVGTPVGTVTATPAGDGALTYAITAGNEAGAFAMGATTGQLTVAGALEASSYALTVSATEAGGGTATVPVTLTVAAPPAVTVAFGQATYTATEGRGRGRDGDGDAERRPAARPDDPADGDAAGRGRGGGPYRRAHQREHRRGRHRGKLRGGGRGRRGGR